MMPIKDEDSMDAQNNNLNSAHSNGAINTVGMSKAEIRKSNKPIMEKKRRARINHCLNELKTLILEAMKKDPARHTKLEKADILEMTVKHLQTIQRQQMMLAAQADSTILHKFKSGFADCADVVTRYLNQMDGLDGAVKQRLANHLNNCVSNIHQQQVGNTFPQFSLPGHQQSSPFHHPFDLNNNSRAGIQVNGVQLVPSRLPSGEIALVMPNSNNVSLNSLINGAMSDNSPSNPTFTPIVKSTPNPTILGQMNSVFNNSLNYSRMSAFNPIGNNGRTSYSGNLSSSPSLHHNNSPPLSPVSSISSSDIESHHADAFNMMSNPASNVATTTPPLSSSGAANSSSSLNISSPLDSFGLLNGQYTRNLQQPQVSSTTEPALLKQQQQQQILVSSKKRSYSVMVNDSFDHRSSSNSPSDTTMEEFLENPRSHRSDKMLKLETEEDLEKMRRLQQDNNAVANGDMWRPW